MKYRRLDPPMMQKLAAIYRLCAALEVKPSDVLPGVTGICDKSHLYMAISQDRKLDDKVKEKLEEFIDDMK